MKGTRCAGTIVCSQLPLELCKKAHCCVIGDSCHHRAGAHCNRLNDVDLCAAAAGAGCGTMGRLRQANSGEATTHGGATHASASPSTAVASQTTAHSTAHVVETSNGEGAATTNIAGHSSTHDDASTSAAADLAATTSAVVHGTEETTHAATHGDTSTMVSSHTSAIEQHGSLHDPTSAQDGSVGAHSTSLAPATSHSTDTDDNVQKKLREFHASAAQTGGAHVVRAGVKVADAEALAQLVALVKMSLSAHPNVRITIVKSGENTTIVVEREDGGALDESTASDAATALAQFDAVSSLVASPVVDNKTTSSAPSSFVSAATVAVVAMVVAVAY